MTFNKETAKRIDRKALSIDRYHRLGRFALCWLLLSALPSGVHADATAPCNVGGGASSTECGVNALSAGNNSTAVGNSASSSAANSTAVGRSASASGSTATAVGDSSEASADDASALGTDASATAARASAVGASARAKSVNAVSLGFVSGFNGGVDVTDSPAAIAIGSFANVGPASPGAIAIGGTDGPLVVTTRGAEATGENAIAIGFEAQANQAGAIALGPHVVADKANTMTVGVPIEVRRNDGTTQVLVNERSLGNTVRTLFNVICNTCTPGFRFNQLLPSNFTWNFRMLQSGAFSVDDPATVGKEAEFRSGGDLKITGTLMQSSSRELKTGIRELEGTEVLSRLERLPVSEWSYKKDNGRVRHIGPMAEDFHAIFEVGQDKQSISSLDTSGVALAGVKSLHQANKQLMAETAQVRSDSEQFQAETGRALARKDQQIAGLIRENRALNQRLSVMEAQLTEIEDIKRQLMVMTAMINGDELAQQMQN